MFENCTQDDVKRIAALAREARRATDQILTEVPEEKLAESRPMRGERSRPNVISVSLLPPDHPARVALEEAIAGLSSEGRWELRALSWIGQGDYGAADWPDAVAAASRSPTATVETLADDADLHEHLTKGLYEVLGLPPRA